jgi:signal transduction histidine kinase
MTIIFQPPRPTEGGSADADEAALRIFVLGLPLAESARQCFAALLPDAEVIAAPTLTDDLLDAADAVIAPADSTVLPIFAEWMAAPCGDRPLLALIIPDDQITPAVMADLSAPALSTPLFFNLRAMLQLRAQLAKSAASPAPAHDDAMILKDAIVHNVSHELKTPVLHCKSAVGLLAEEMPSNKLVGYATEAVSRLEQVVMNLSLLVDSINVNPGPVLVRDAINQAMRSLRRSWEHKDSLDRVQIQLPDRLPAVLADTKGLAIVLQLLLDNALKFSTDRVTVEAQDEGQTVRVTISDHGIGIPASALTHIFEHFYQVDTSSTRRFGGAGIGLSLVQLILDRHHADIEVVSEENKGSSFSFALPVIDLRQYVQNVGQKSAAFYDSI